MSLSVVCWKWKPKEGYRSTYGPEQVNIFAQMVKRNYSKPHKVICVTDDPKGIDPKIQVIPLWDIYSNLQNPSGPMNPSCYRRLKMFSTEAKDLFGDRFVSVDLDCVITGDMSPVWDRPEDFVAWGDSNPTTYYNGSMILMTAGSRKKVWEDFHPISSPLAAKQAGHFGSDQAWISFCLGPDEKKWTKNDGVYSYRNHLSNKYTSLPSNAKIVIFHGKYDPWSPNIARIDWVKRHYSYLPRTKDTLDVQSINLKSRLAILTNGKWGRIIELYDDAGSLTEDASKAQAFVVKAENKFYSGAVSHYNTVRTQ